MSITFFGIETNPSLIWARITGANIDPENPPTTLPTTPEEREQFFIFSPLFRVDDATPEMLIMALAAVKVAKQPKGLEVLRDLGVEYLKTIGKTLVALENSSSTNWLNCWINQKLSLRVMRRLGLITPFDAADLDSSYNMMFNVMQAKAAIVDTITALGSFTNILGSAVPTK